MRQKKIILYVTNNSSQQIDSVIIPYPFNKISKPIAVKERREFSIDVSQIDIRNKGGLIMNLYQKNRMLTTGWGVHDLGEFLNEKEEYYVFDQGISSKNESLEKPKKFEIFFSNRSDSKVDSFFNNMNSIISIFEITPRRFDIILDYEKIEQEPFLTIQLGGIKYEAKIIHDFDNWNNPQEFLVFENGRLERQDPQKKIPPLEFIVDLNVEGNIQLDSIHVNTPGVTKIYDDEKSRSKRIVFDYKALSRNPIFAIQLNKKAYSKDLSTLFKNPDITQKIYYFSKSELKELLAK